MGRPIVYDLSIVGPTQRKKKSCNIPFIRARCEAFTLVVRRDNPVLRQLRQVGNSLQTVLWGAVDLRIAPPVDHPQPHDGSQDIVGKVLLARLAVVEHHQKTMLEFPAVTSSPSALQFIQETRCGEVAERLKAAVC